MHRHVTIVHEVVALVNQDVSVGSQSDITEVFSNESHMQCAHDVGLLITARVPSCLKLVATFHRLDRQINSRFLWDGICSSTWMQSEVEEGLNQLFISPGFLIATLLSLL